MTHDELLEAVKDNPTTLAVVELHKPHIFTDNDGYEWFYCTVCTDGFETFPCPTIQTIEKELL